MADAAPRFTGFSRAGIQFLADLAANNDRAWFPSRPEARDENHALCLPDALRVATSHARAI